MELLQVELPATGPAVWERDLFVGFFVLLPGESGLLLRRGPGMVLHLADGRRLAVPMRRPLVAARCSVHVVRQGSATRALRVRETADP